MDKERIIDLLNTRYNTFEISNFFKDNIVPLNAFCGVNRDWVTRIDFQLRAKVKL